MPKLIKPLAIIISVMIAVLAIASWLIDPNDFKTELGDLVKKRIGRDLTIVGELKLSVFPWLGVSTGQLLLSNAQGFQDQPFASIGQSEFGVKLTSIFTKQLEISHIGLRDVKVNLSTNAQGQSNWSDLAASNTGSAGNNAKSMSTSGQAASAAGFEIAGLSVENAQINWDDRQAKQQYTLDHINLKTGAVMAEKPIAVDLALVAINNNTKSTQTITLNTELYLNGQFEPLTITKPNLQLVLTGEGIPNKQLPLKLSATEVSFDWPQQLIKASGLQMASSEMALAAELQISQFKGQLKIQGPINILPFNPTKTLKQLAIAVPVLQDAKALSTLALNGDLQASAEAAQLQNLEVKLDDSTFKGMVGLNYANKPELSFNINIDTINADRYLPTDSAKAAKNLASSAVAIAAGAAMIPLATLQKFNADGELAIDTVKINGLTLQGLSLKLSAQDGLVKTSQSAQKFYQGDYSGDADINANKKPPQVSVHEKISHVQIQPFLKDAYNDLQTMGTIDASVQLKAQGESAKQLKSSLTGQLSFLIKDTVLKGFNLQKIIDQAKKLAQDSKPPAAGKSEQTLFSELSGTAAIANGIITNNDLTGKAAKLNLTGKGSADLNTDQLNYQITAKLPGAAAPELAINVTGSLKQPNYQIDVAKLVTKEQATKVVDKVLEHNKDKIEKLLDKLDKKLGPGAADLLKKIF